MKHIIILFIGFLTYSAFGQVKQNIDYCKAECILPDRYVSEVVSYYIYTGTQSNAPFTQKMEVSLAPERKTWRKAPDPNCLSGEPSDCMIWTLVDAEAEFITLTVVTDIDQQPNYVKEQFSRIRKKSEGGSVETLEVVCKEDMTPTLMHDLSMRLTDLGYYSGYLFTVYNSTLKTALEHFQIHNGLPVGHLDRKTMEALDLPFPEL
jgi:hypothetical protein